MKLFFSFLAIGILYSFFINYFRFRRTFYYYNKFLSQSEDLKYCGSTIAYLWEKAGIKKGIASGRHSGQNIAFYVTYKSYGSEIDHLFRSAISVYIFRLKNSFNPIIWLTYPSIIAQSHVAKRIPSIGKGAVNLAFWIIGVIASHYIELFLVSDAFRHMIEVFCNTL